MPFGPAFSPSIGLSLLQPQIQRQNLSCRILYFTIAFAERIGQNFYSSLASDHRGALRDFAGEWMFSDALFERGPDAERQYVQDILIERKAWSNKQWARPLSRARIDAILRAKSRVPHFLDTCVERIAEMAPRIIGFTSVFQQHVASLALAKRVKACLPETLVVFGGANCEGAMGAETVRQCSFVDAVVSGEGDLVFPELARRVASGQPWTDLPGVVSQQTVHRAFAAGRFPNTPVVVDLDALPYPDYGDYFDQFNRTRLARDWQPGVFVETSRGCWWGERMHCTFCGLNGGTMTFRSKSADRAYEELKHLAATYPESDVQVVDNILDLKYFKTLLPTLAQKPLNIDLFYETKSNLKKDQVRLLRDARVKAIQPGIESLSDQVLKLMKKGVSGLQNIQLLKWCKEFGVEPQWNFLCGFPGESPDEYRRMAEMMPSLIHLPGPSGLSVIRLDRFSPNYFDAAKLGFANVRPLAPYRFIYDFSEEALGNLAYYFEYDYQNPTDVAGYVRGVLPKLKAWRASWQRYELLIVDDQQGIAAVIDTRPSSRRSLTVLKDLDRQIYLACDEVSEPERIANAISAAGSSADRDQIAERLAAMVDRGIILKDGQRYLALAVALGEYASAGPAAEGVLRELSELSARHTGNLRIRLDNSEYQIDGKVPDRESNRLRSANLRRCNHRSGKVRLGRSDFRIIRRRELRVRRVTTSPSAY